MITSTNVSQSLEKSAIYAENLVRSQLKHLLINLNDSKQYPVSSGIGLTGVTDTNTIRDVIMWEIQGREIEIEIGYGSEIRILDGRIVGVNLRFDQSIGIHLTENNGGVHIENTDIIALGTGILIENTNGTGSN